MIRGRALKEFLYEPVIENATGSFDNTAINLAKADGKEYGSGNARKYRTLAIKIFQEAARHGYVDNFNGPTESDGKNEKDLFIVSCLCSSFRRTASYSDDVGEEFVQEYNSHEKEAIQKVLEKYLR